MILSLLEIKSFLKEASDVCESLILRFKLNCIVLESLIRRFKLNFIVLVHSGFPIMAHSQYRTLPVDILNRYHLVVTFTHLLLSTKQFFESLQM